MSTTNLTAQQVWDKLGDIPVDNDGNLEQELSMPTSYGALSFPIGTDREDVWHWIEEEYKLSVTELLYPH